MRRCSKAVEKITSLNSTALEGRRNYPSRMTRVLLTAFKPYDRWQQNASWLAVVEFTKDKPATPDIVTRVYDVDFDLVRDQLAKDLAEDYDYALHVGQAPGSTRVQLEAFGVNIGGHSRQLPDEFAPLISGGPPAYQSELPLASLAGKLREAEIPAQVSYHAGTYLCNATMYLGHHLAATMGLKTKSTFVHLPLDTSQVMDQEEILPSLPAAQSAKALQIIVASLD